MCESHIGPMAAKGAKAVPTRRHFTPEQEHFTSHTHPTMSLSHHHYNPTNNSSHHTTKTNTTNHSSGMYLSRNSEAAFHSHAKEEDPEQDSDVVLDRTVLVYEDAAETSHTNTFIPSTSLPRTPARHRVLKSKNHHRSSKKRKFLGRNPLRKGNSTDNSGFSTQYNSNTSINSPNSKTHLLSMMRQQGNSLNYNSQQNDNNKENFQNSSNFEAQVSQKKHRKSAASSRTSLRMLSQSSNNTPRTSRYASGNNNRSHHPIERNQNDDYLSSTTASSFRPDQNSVKVLTGYSSTEQLDAQNEDQPLDSSFSFYSGASQNFSSIYYTRGSAASDSQWSPLRHNKWRSSSHRRVPSQSKKSSLNANSILIYSNAAANGDTGGALSAHPSRKHSSTLPHVSSGTGSQQNLDYLSAIPFEEEEEEDDPSAISGSLKHDASLYFSNPYTIVPAPLDGMHSKLIPGSTPLWKLTTLVTCLGVQYLCFAIQFTNIQLSNQYLKNILLGSTGVSSSFAPPSTDDTTLLQFFFSKENLVNGIWIAGLFASLSAELLLGVSAIVPFLFSFQNLSWRRWLLRTKRKHQFSRFRLQVLRVVLIAGAIVSHMILGVIQRSHFFLISSLLCFISLIAFGCVHFMQSAPIWCVYLITIISFLSLNFFLTMVQAILRGTLVNHIGHASGNNSSFESDEEPITPVSSATPSESANPEASSSQSTAKLDSVPSVLVILSIVSSLASCLSFSIGALSFTDLFADPFMNGNISFYIYPFLAVCILIISVFTYLLALRSESQCFTEQSQESLPNNPVTTIGTSVWQFEPSLDTSGIHDISKREIDEYLWREKVLSQKLRYYFAQVLSSQFLQIPKAIFQASLIHFSALVCHFVVIIYTCDYFGIQIFGGSPHAEASSSDAVRYAYGQKIGILALFLMSCCAVASSFVVPVWSKILGFKSMWMSAFFLQGLCLTVLVFLNHPIVALILYALQGFSLSVLFIMPLTLVVKRGCSGGEGNVSLFHLSLFQCSQYLPALVALPVGIIFSYLFVTVLHLPFGSIFLIGALMEFLASYMVLFVGGGGESAPPKDQLQTESLVEEDQLQTPTN